DSVPHLARRSGALVAGAEEGKEVLVVLIQAAARRAVGRRAGALVLRDVAGGDVERARAQAGAGAVQAIVGAVATLAVDRDGRAGAGAEGLGADARPAGADAVLVEPGEEIFRRS